MHCPHLADLTMASVQRTVFAKSIVLSRRGPFRHIYGHRRWTIPLSNLSELETYSDPRCDEDEDLDDVEKQATEFYVRRKQVEELLLDVVSEGQPPSRHGLVVSGPLIARYVVDSDSVCVLTRRKLLRGRC